MAERFRVSTLPPSVRDRRTLAFAEAFQRAFQDPDFRRLLMEHFDSAPSEALPALIREFSIEEFVEPGMNETVIRRLLAGSFEMHAKKGYLEGIRKGLALIGMSVDWVQWYEKTPKGQPGTHTATVYATEFIFDNQGAILDARVQRAALRMIDGTKRWSQDVEFVIGVGFKQKLGMVGIEQAVMARRESAEAAMPMPHAQSGIVGISSGTQVARIPVFSALPVLSSVYSTFSMFTPIQLVHVALEVIEP